MKNKSNNQQSSQADLAAKELLLAETNTAAIQENQPNDGAADDQGNVDEGDKVIASNGITDIDGEGSTNAPNVNALGVEDSQQPGTADQGAEQNEQLNENTSQIDPVVDAPVVENTQAPVTTDDNGFQANEVNETVEPVVLTKVLGRSLIRDRIMSILETYAVEMAPRKPVTDHKVDEQQRLLYEALVKTINDTGDEFETVLKEVLVFFYKHNDGLFHEVRVFRGMSTIPLSTEDRKTFLGLLNLFKLVADPKSRSLAIQQVDLEASLQYGISETGRNRMLGFFHQ